jgi:hypothetical protein
MYLDEGDLDVVLDMRVPVPHVAHDEVAELAAELHSGGASADHHAVQPCRRRFFSSSDRPVHLRIEMGSPATENNAYITQLN